MAGPADGLVARLIGDLNAGGSAAQQRWERFFHRRIQLAPKPAARWPADRGAAQRSTCRWRAIHAGGDCPTLGRAERTAMRKQDVIREAWLQGRPANHDGRVHSDDAWGSSQAAGGAIRRGGRQLPSRLAGRGRRSRNTLARRRRNRPALLGESLTWERELRCPYGERPEALEHLDRSPGRARINRAL